MARIRLPQGTNLAFIGELVAERDNFGNATEVFYQPDRIAERLTTDVVDGGHIVEQMRIRDILKHGLPQIFKDGLVFPDAERRDLFMVSDDDNLSAHVERNKGIQI